MSNWLPSRSKAKPKQTDVPDRKFKVNLKWSKVNVDEPQSRKRELWEISTEKIKKPPNTLNKIEESMTNEAFSVQTDGEDDIGVLVAINEAEKSDGRGRDPIAFRTTIPEARSQRNKIGASRWEGGIG